MEDSNLIHRIVAYFKHKIKRIAQRIVIKSNRKMLNEDPRPKSPYEMEAFRMCKYFIKRPDSELTMSTDGTKYIYSKDENIDIFIKRNLVEIIVDKKYPYDVVLCDRMYMRIVRIFDNNVNERRKTRELAVTSGVKYSLNGVLNAIIEKQKHNENNLST